MPESSTSFKGSGMLVVTSKGGSISDPCRQAAQILRASSHSRVLAKEEVLDILEGVGIPKTDAFRIYRDLLKKEYLKEL